MAPAHGELLVGCGIFRREVEFLIRKNRWTLRTEFLDSSLHIDLRALQQQLTGALDRHREERPIVFYGCCHPLMERFLAKASCLRTEGQNCVEMLLGRERFMAELEHGAFFLLEDWAHRWHQIMGQTFSGNWPVAREIFQQCHRYLLAIRTPLSEDFRSAAEQAAASVELPLRWTDSGLEHLERVLQNAVERRHQMPIAP